MEKILDLPLNGCQNSCLYIAPSPFRSPCLSISRLEDPTGVKVNPCPVRDYIIFITDLPPGMVTLRIYKHYGLFWVKPDSPSPNSFPKLLVLFTSSQSLRKFSQFTCNHLYWSTPSKMLVRPIHFIKP